MSTLLRTSFLLAALGAASVLLKAQIDPSPGQVRVTLSGVAREFASDLQAVVARDTTVGRDSLVALVRRWYAEQGFLHAEAAVERMEAGEWSVRVVEGPPATVGELRIEGLGPAEIDELRESLTLKPGERFHPERLERDIATMLDRVERSGRPLASASIEGFDDVDDGSTCRVDIIIRVTPGPALTIGAVRVAGNSATTAATVRRASGLREGDLWTSRSAAAAVRRLHRTRLFTNVGEPLVELNEQQRLIITLPVTEGRHSSFDGMVGYLPPTADGGAGTITGLVDVRLGNLLGTARRLSLRWFQERQATQEIDVAYREPWVLDSEIDADLTFHQRKQDSLFVRQQVGLGAFGRLDGSISVGGSYTQLSTTPIEGYGASVLSSSDQRLFGLRFEVDTRDDAVTPRVGAFYAADLQAGRKRSSGVGVSTSTSMQRLRADVAFAVSPFRAQTFIVEAHGIDVRSGTLDPADLVRLGGATSVRGYREGEFLGSQLAWATLEHRFFFTSRSFLGAFVDGAFISRPSLASIGLAASEVVRFGYGLTLRVDAPVGLLGVSIALGEGDGFGDAKLHVRVQSEF
jgi:outer membrane protein insertion porin family